MSLRSSYTPLFKEFRPEKIKVADGIPGRPGTEIKSLSIQDYEKRMNVKWNGTILIKEPLINSENESSVAPKVPDSFLNPILKQIANTQKSFVICNMGAPFGYGLYGKAKKDEYVGVYCGIQFSDRIYQEENSDNTYHFTVDDLTGKPLGRIDAKEGDYLRYVMHAPENTLRGDNAINVTDIEFSNKEDQKNLLTANVTTVACRYKNSMVLLFKANQDIDGLFAVSYGQFWLNKNIVPALCLKDGTKIDPSQYSFERFECKFIINPSQVSIVYLEKTQIITCFVSGLTIEPKTNEGIKQFYISGKEFVSIYNNRQPGTHFLIFNRPSNIIYNNNVIGELQRITESFCTGLIWKYKAEKKLAWLCDKNLTEDMLKNIVDFLREKGLAVKFGKNGNTKEWMIYVNDVTKEKLESIKPYSAPILK